MSDDASRVRALLTLYRESHYDVELPRGGLATMRIGKPVPEPIADWIGGDGTAYFLTACNPRSVQLADEENDARLTRLRAEFDVRGAAYLAGAGHMPGKTWVEASVLVRGLAGGDVDDIVRRYEQNAIVIVRGGSATLRIYRADWRGIVGDVADIEWR